MLRVYFWVLKGNVYLDSESHDYVSLWFYLVGFNVNIGYDKLT